MAVLAIVLAMFVHHLGHRVAARLLNVDGEGSVLGCCALKDSAAPLGKRAVLLVSGSVASYLLAVVPLTLLMAREVSGPSLTIESVHAGLPAERAGIQAGDRIVAVDGAPAADFGQVRDAVMARPTQVHLDVRRANEVLSFDLAPDILPEGQAVIGIAPKQETTQPTLGVAFVNAHRVPFRGLVGLFDSRTTTVGGPVRLYVVNSKREPGLLGAMALAMTTGLALDSGLLALVHLLPLPGLDGGLLLLALREALGGRKPDYPWQARARKKLLWVAAGLAVLLFALVLKNDVSRLMQ